MSALETALREAIGNGRLQGLTLWPASDGRWQGNARWQGSTGWTVVIDNDPVQALVGALGGKPNRDRNGTRLPAEPAPEPTGGVFD